MAWRPRSLSLPYDSWAFSANSAAISVHNPNCEYCAYVSCTRLAARTDSARSTFCARRWTRAAALMLGLESPATTACRAPSATSSAGPLDVRRRNRNPLVMGGLSRCRLHTLEDELLHPAAGIDFSRVQIPLGISRHMVRVAEVAGL